MSQLPFHLVIERESPSLSLGEDRLAVHHDVELAGASGPDINLCAESGFEAGCQTGSARAIASS
jgi:hypothetical protein